MDHNVRLVMVPLALQTQDIRSFHHSAAIGSTAEKRLTWSAMCCTRVLFPVPVSPTRRVDSLWPMATATASMVRRTWAV